MRCVHFATSLDPRHGGVSRIAPALAKAQREELGWDAVAVDDESVPFHANAPPPDLLHLHGLWEPPLRRLASEAWRRGVPYAVTLHGMLDRWSRERRWWKKRAAWLLYQNAILRRAAFVVANSEEEAEEARDWTGRAVPFEIIPNGVEPPPAVAEGAVDRLLARLAIPADVPLLLYFGRLHPKKGVLLLPEIVERAAAALPNLHLIVAGPESPDSPGLRNRLRADFARRGETERARVVGMLDGEERWAALAASDLFLLPSSEEGMPMAALEALASGTPALLTPECRLGGIEPEGAGRLARRDPAAFAGAAVAMLSLSAEQRLAAGEAARRYARERHSWEGAARQLAEAWGRRTSLPTGL